MDTKAEYYIILWEFDSRTDHSSVPFFFLPQTRYSSVNVPIPLKIFFFIREGGNREKFNFLWKYSKILEGEREGKTAKELWCSYTIVI